MQICTKHKCRLEKSAITAKSERTYTLCPAEEYVTEQQSKNETNSLLIDYCKYLYDVFNSGIDFKRDIPISAVLYNAIVGTKYITSKGKTKLIKLLSDDLKAFYENIGISDIASYNQVQREFSGERFDFTVICQLAIILKVNIKNLTAPLITNEEIERERNTHLSEN